MNEYSSLVLGGGCWVYVRLGSLQSSSVQIENVMLRILAVTSACARVDELAAGATRMYVFSSRRKPSSLTDCTLLEC